MEKGNKSDHGDGTTTLARRTDNDSADDPLKASSIIIIGIHLDEWTKKGN
jgi:hypothetical protein